jgi:hypothetical protein
VLPRLLYRDKKKLSGVFCAFFVRRFQSAHHQIAVSHEQLAGASLTPASHLGKGVALHQQTTSLQCW